MPVLAVIPARFASSRFPGKPLEVLTGCTGIKKSLIRRTWEAASQAGSIDRLAVATDDVRVRDEVESFGGECIMTSSACGNGTERCAETLDYFGDYFDIIVNVQGDAPLTPPWFVDDLVAAMRKSPGTGVATPVVRCDGAALKKFKEDSAKGLTGATTTVFDAKWRALYFSKQIIPWTGGGRFAGEPAPVFHHVGVYSYTPSALQFYLERRPSVLERQEGLEQLRFLEYGEPVLCVEVDGRGREFWEVNNPDDIERVEAGLRAAGIE